jgi:hypothetical protein
LSTLAAILPGSSLAKADVSGKAKAKINATPITIFLILNLCIDFPFRYYFT